MELLFKRLIVLILLLSIVGCENLSSRQSASDVEEVHRRPTNIDYYLPKVSYEIKAIYKLKKCDASVYVKDGKAALFQQFGIDSPGVVVSKPEVKTTYTLVQKYGADYPVLFSLDAEKLPSGIQDQNVVIALHENGTLKSVNSTVTDQTGTIFTTVLKFITNIAGIGSISHAADALQTFQTMDMEDRPKRIALCKSSVQAALDEVEKNDADIADLKKKLRDLKIDNGDPRVIKARFDVIDRKIAVLTARSDYLKSKILTIEFTHTIEPDAATNGNVFYPPTALLEKKWFDLYAMQALVSSMDTALLGGELYFDNIPDEVITAADAKQFDKEDNLVVRRTFQTSFKLCHQKCKYNDGRPVEQVFMGQTRVPQWAGIDIIDFDAKIFENRTVNLQFGADGNMTSLAYSQKSKVSNAVNALSSASGEYKNLADVRLTGDDAAEISYLDKEVKKIKLRRELETLLEPSIDDQ